MSVQREASYITFNKSITFVSLALGEQITGICKGLNISEYLNIRSLNYNIHMFILILPHELLLLSAFANREEWGNYARIFFKYSNYCKTAFGFSAALSATFIIFRHTGNWDRPALRLRLSCLKTDLPGSRDSPTAWNWDCPAWNWDFVLWTREKISTQWVQLWPST